MLKLLTVIAMALSVAGAQAQTEFVVPPGFPATPIVSAAAEGSHILKAAKGTLISLYVTAGASAGYLMTLNSATVPADGAVTPINCVQVAANNTVALNFAPQPPEYYSTGIVVVFSTTGCFTKTISNTAYFHALVQ